ncbi:MAG: septation protein SpoVG family protein [Candidatus Omnitrophica bacterium]|nr:septation protein SpoVG family protein [Candidatus Omnitrophota bacterium]
MDKVTISEVSFYPLRPNEKGLIGFASVVFDNKLSLNSIAVYTRPDGSDYRLLFPSKQLPNGREIQTFYPINKETAELIKEAVVKKIEELTEKMEKKYEQTET